MNSMTFFVVPGGLHFHGPFEGFVGRSRDAPSFKKESQVLSSCKSGGQITGSCADAAEREVVGISLGPKILEGLRQCMMICDT